MVLLHTQQTIKYFRVAPAAVWALDYCLTLEHEVRLFSKMGRWNITTVMFIVARYVPIVWIISEIYVTLGPQSLQMCLTTYRTAGVSLLLIMLAAEGLLLMRTLALWHDNRKIRRLLSAIYLVTAISTITCIANSITDHLLESACVPTTAPSDLEIVTRLERLIMGGFVSMAFFELTVAAITVYHSMHLRSVDMHNLRKIAPTLSKGSLVYALSLFAISIANIVSFSLPVSNGYSGIIDVFQGVLHGVIASRILFDLRDADQRNKDIFCLSDLQFEPHRISTATSGNV
ncbi:uncharacterized protein BJ212DRAFT_821510 [Suillus subaureus]|uniref:DUF6533 domain-containing protein n=1 Tax=Suillus subaureus TaxID=48587 RepID=A0A9P7JHC2_9AGAM|nr:uncharacterized protein BJ212DRAFT_821510 [Suillus subaureus]KAG1822687.1 hypothetical protein BJ212DRAFT_821510 [Suillus subaureus]